MDYKMHRMSLMLAVVAAISLFTSLELVISALETGFADLPNSIFYVLTAVILSVLGAVSYRAGHRFYKRSFKSFGE